MTHKDKLVIETQPQGIAVWSDAIERLKNPTITEGQRAFYTAIVKFYERVEYGSGIVN